MIIVRKISSGISDDFVKKIQFLQNSIIPTIESSMVEAEAEARANHRFKNRTGNLESNILSETVKTENGVDSKLYIHDRASYGVYVHDGHRSWEPDPFIREPFFKFVEKIDNEIKENLNR